MAKDEEKKKEEEKKDVQKLEPEAVKKIFGENFQIQFLFKNHISGQDEPKGTSSAAAVIRKKKETGGDPKIKEIILSDVRAVLEKRIDAKWSFCLENRATVSSDTLLTVYLGMVTKNQEVLKSAGGTLSVFSIFLAVEDAMSPAAAKFTPTEKASLDLRKIEGLVTAPGVPPSYKAASWGKEDDWKVDGKPTAPGMLDCVVDFAAADWDKIMMINKTLYGFTVRGTELQIISARQPAFEINDAMKSIKGPHLPEFAEIADTPHIDITEVDNAFQSSLADNAFSARSIETMISGTSPLISANVSAGMRSESMHGRGTNQGGSKREYHATYNFPRVKLFLDRLTLKLTDQCKTSINELKANQTLERLIEFQARYGVIFAQEVTLGGRLQSTKAADAAFSTENNSEKEAFKAAVGAGVSVGSFSTSVKADTETATSRAGESSRSSGISAISYTARGGDTLRCANPASWAGTVAVWRNWRVIQQDEPISLATLIGSMPGFEFVPEITTKILSTAPVSLQNPRMHLNSRKLWIGGEKVPGHTFTIRNGDPGDRVSGPRDEVCVPPDPSTRSYTRPQRLILSFSTKKAVLRTALLAQ
ncbi:hypothetical protein BCR34DRAFT_645688 [Clohesyomyces aquaticus]|uniref:MACPF-like domain-containing protein n=1 Tax=Clohesyomyces aquaticus TaxID=1231657 RepID=A0A1Y1ZWM9_9PLEO|nr:hypothetical protein BCR34DRAFT_645688 [Clohesyomyces aquaticus]